MTNFEKWKESATVLDVFRIMDNSNPCYNCPARKQCKADSDTSKTCGLKFQEWANKEAL